MVRFLAQYLDAARLPVILVVAINLVVLFLLLDRLIDRRAAFLAAGLIALDPFAVALGSILHVDALMMTFSLNSLAALCVALNSQRQRALADGVRRIGRAGDVEQIAGGDFECCGVHHRRRSIPCGSGGRSGMRCVIC